jgi:hypothetical protein
MNLARTYATSQTIARASFSVAAFSTARLLGFLILAVQLYSQNLPPSVTLISPFPNTVLQFPGTVLLAAQASDPDGRISWVSFYAGTTKIADDLSSPYEYTWQGIPAGYYTINAQARDDRGELAVSSPVVLKVTRKYSIHYASSPILIDGQAQEWSAVPGVTFSNTSGRTPPSVDNTVTVRLLWDTEALYGMFEITDTNLWATGTVRDGVIWWDDCIEIHIDTLNDGGSAMRPDDYHLILTVANVLNDARGTGIGRDPSWDCEGWASSVTLVGTMNNNSDVDVGALIEVCLPWRSIGGFPGTDKTIGLNLSVVDRDASSDVYRAFSWVGLTDFLTPDMWGTAILESSVTASAASVCLTALPTTLPADGNAIAFLTALLEDADGNRVFSASHTVEFVFTERVNGSFVSRNPVAALDGAAWVAYRSGTAPGTVTIGAVAAGLSSATVSLTLVDPTTARPAERNAFNYPNPFRVGAMTTVRFDAPVPGRAELVIYDLLGRVVYRYAGDVATGTNEWFWDGRNHAGAYVETGVYLGVLTCNGRIWKWFLGVQ